jgi:hypothetical protein
MARLPLLNEKEARAEIRADLPQEEPKWWQQLPLAQNQHIEPTVGLEIKKQRKRARLIMLQRFTNRALSPKALYPTI